MGSHLSASVGSHLSTSVGIHLGRRFLSMIDFTSWPLPPLTVFWSVVSSPGVAACRLASWRFLSPPRADLRLAVASTSQREARQRRSPGFAHQDAAHVAPERCHVRQRRERHVELDYHELVRADSLVQVAVRRCLVKLIVAWPGPLLLRVRGRRQIVSSFCSPLVASLRLLMVNPRVLNRIWLALPASSSCVIVAHRP